MSSNEMVPGSASADSEDGHVGEADDFLGDAPEEEPSDAGPPVRPHDDEVDTGLVGVVEDRVRTAPSRTAAVMDRPSVSTWSAWDSMKASAGESPS